MDISNARCTAKSLPTSQKSLQTLFEESMRWKHKWHYKYSNKLVTNITISKVYKKENILFSWKPTQTYKMYKHTVERQKYCRIVGQRVCEGAEGGRKRKRGGNPEEKSSRLCEPPSVAFENKIYNFLILYIINFKGYPTITRLFWH